MALRKFTFQKLGFSVQQSCPPISLFALKWGITGSCMSVVKSVESGSPQHVEDAFNLSEFYGLFPKKFVSGKFPRFNWISRSTSTLTFPAGNRFALQVMFALNLSHVLITLNIKCHHMFAHHSVCLPFRRDESFYGCCALYFPPGSRASRNSYQ